MTRTPQPKLSVEEGSAHSRLRSMFAIRTPTPDPKKPLHLSSHTSTPDTVAMTPSTPFSESSRRDVSDDGYLGEHEAYRVKRLFREENHRHDDSHRSDSCIIKSPSSRKTRRHSSALRRSSKSTSRFRSIKSLDRFELNITPSTSSSTDASDDSSSDLYSLTKLKRAGSLVVDEKKRSKLSHQNSLILILAVVLCLSMGMIFRSDRTLNDEFLQQYERTIRHHQRHHKGTMAAGLRGKLVMMTGGRDYVEQLQFRPPHAHVDQEVSPGKTRSLNQDGSLKRYEKVVRYASGGSTHERLAFHPKPPITLSLHPFESQDPAMYRPTHSKKTSTSRRVFSFGKHPLTIPRRSLSLYPSDFTDNTQFYGIYDSEDEHLSHMEVRQPLDDGVCVPMKEWQTTFYPLCNGMHELGMEHIGDDSSPEDFLLFGTKGYWRNAWKVNGGPNSSETIVLKTLKFQHNFEDAHFEHDRVDAVAMERLTSSPHVINIFGFCGHSVMTEFADGSRLGELADKNKKIPLARLRIARDIAQGLADVHGIDGDGPATFVHLDINPANVVSIGGTLKLNDFNIGILRRWNTTSNTPCGFPAQFPNPQWRSPEEARNEQNLSEKVDVFSLGHIFFRLICAHEPWNKLEEGGKPLKEVINAKVQRGELPRIPDEVMMSTDPEVVVIRDVMMECYAFDPKDRPSARNIATRLLSALELLEKGASATV